MTKAIVIYNSRGGNTEKVAKKIAEGLGVEYRDHKNIPDLEEYELLVLGSWIIMGMISFAGATYLRKLRRKKIDGKKVALFFTSGAPDDIHPKTENEVPKKIKEVMFERMEEIVIKKNQVSVIPKRFHCKGAIRLWKRKEPTHNIENPTEEEILQAKAFGQMLREKLS